MSSSLHKYQRDILAKPFRFWTTDLSKEDEDQLVRDIVDVFYSWKERQADADGKVAVIGGGGLPLPLTTEMRDYTEIEPWQCGGPEVRNDIDLAYKLWLDDDEKFSLLLDKHGLGKVFSVIGLWCVRTVEAASLIRLNGLATLLMQLEIVLARRKLAQLQGELELSAATKQNRMRELQRARASEVREQTARRNDNMRAMALEYAMDNPRALQRDVISHLQKQGYTQTRGTIARLIAGVVTEAKSRPLGKTDLYGRVLTSKR